MAEFSWGGITPTYRTDTGIAVIGVSGPLEHHASWCWDSYERILCSVEEAMCGADMARLHEQANWWKDDFEPLPEDQWMPARAVVLNVDSPGGEAAGTMAAHRKLRQLRNHYKIPLFAFANETACSAAYAIASAADAIFLPDIATIGSIGVVATLFDRTLQNEKDGVVVELVTSGEYKADGHADRPLTDGIRERMQYRVDKLAGVFWGVVARARTRATGKLMSARTVAGLQAGVFIGSDAVDVGIGDVVCEWDECLERIEESLIGGDADEIEVVNAAE